MFMVIGICFAVVCRWKTTSLKLLKLVYKTDKKAKEWMNTVNPHIGNASPYNLILTGKGEKVLKFIKACGAGY